MKKSMQDVSLQSGLKNVTGGLVGDDWVSESLLGNSVLAAAEDVSDLFHGKILSVAGSEAKDAAGEAVEYGAKKVASYVPIAHRLVAGAFEVLSAVKLPFDLTVASFASLTCSIGR